MISAIEEYIAFLYAVTEYGKAEEKTLDERIDLAKRYLQKCDPAISGQRGHSTLFRVCCKIGPGFSLPPEIAFEVLWSLYNPRCEPPWSESALRHKLTDAYRTEKRRGWMVIKRV